MFTVYAIMHAHMYMRVTCFHPTHVRSLSLFALNLLPTSSTAMLSHSTDNNISNPHAIQFDMTHSHVSHVPFIYVT